MTGVVDVGTVERFRIEEDRDRLVECHAVFLRVGVSLARVPLKHALSIYSLFLGRGELQPGALMV